VKIGFFTISTFDLIPLCKHVTNYLCGINDNTVDLIQCSVKNFTQYHEKVSIISIGMYNRRDEVTKQSLSFKINKYLKLIYQILKFQIQNRRALLYTIDLPTLNILLLTSLLFFFNRNFIIYHQFEIIDPDSSTRYNKLIFSFFKAFKKKLNLFIAPELNRINYFTTIAGFPKEKTLLFANTTMPCSCLENGVNMKENNCITIAHVGIAGYDHYVKQFLEILKEIQYEDKFKVLFIGYLPEKVRRLIKSYNLSIVEIIDDIPHKDLMEYYEKIDIGIILYRDVGLNYKFCAPNKLYEYWANGIYVIAHPLEGLKPLFGEKKLGKLCNMDDKELFLEGFLHTINNFDKKNKIEIKTIFEKKYSVERFLEEFSEILKERFKAYK